MSAAQVSTAASVTPQTTLARLLCIVRAAVLFAGGLTITFSATLHETIAFDLVVTASLFSVLGVLHVADWFARRGTPARSISLLLGIVSLVVAGALPFAATPIVFAVLVAAWALIGALLEFVGMVVQPGGRSDATLLGALGVLLALAVLLVRDDPVAIIGMVGAYAIIAGVFLGISAFDRRRTDGAELSVPSAGQATEPTLS